MDNIRPAEMQRKAFLQRINLGKGLLNNFITNCANVKSKFENVFGGYLGFSGWSGSDNLPFGKNTSVIAHLMDHGEYQSPSVGYKDMIEASFVFNSNDRFESAGCAADLMKNAALAVSYFGKKGKSTEIMDLQIATNGHRARLVLDFASGELYDMTENPVSYSVYFAGGSDKKEISAKRVITLDRLSSSHLKEILLKYGINDVDFKIDEERISIKKLGEPSGDQSGNWRVDLENHVTIIE